MSCVCVCVCVPSSTCFCSVLIHKQNQPQESKRVRGALGRATLRRDTCRWRVSSPALLRFCLLLPVLEWFLHLMSCVSPLTYFFVVLVAVHCFEAVCFFQLSSLNAWHAISRLPCSSRSAHRHNRRNGCPPVMSDVSRMCLCVIMMVIVRVDVISSGPFSSVCFITVPVPLNLSICAGIASPCPLLTFALISTERNPGPIVSFGNAQP